MSGVSAIPLILNLPEATATESSAVSLDTTAVTATDTTVSEIPSNQLEAPKTEAGVK